MNRISNEKTVEFLSEVLLYFRSITTLISLFHRTDNCVIKTLPRFSIDSFEDKFNVTSHIHDIRCDS